MRRKTLSVVCALLAFLSGGCSDSSRSDRGGSSKDTDAGTIAPRCDFDDYLAMTEICGVSLDFFGFDTCQDPGLIVKAPEGYRHSEEFATLVEERCRARDAAAQMTCLGEMCRQLGAFYAGPNGQPDTLFIHNLLEMGLSLGAECSGLTFTPSLECVEQCLEESGYARSFYDSVYKFSAPLEGCQSDFWEGCRTCETDRYSAYDACRKQCASGACDLTANGKLDGRETDVDCGGPDCVACAETEKCRSGNDCRSGSCVSGVCRKSTCSDGVRNGIEADVDCGPGCSSKCSSGAVCHHDNDCESGACRGVNASVKRCQ